MYRVLHVMCSEQPGHLTTAAVRDALFKAEVLDLRDLLALRASCKALRDLITGSMPAYLHYSLYQVGACLCSQTKRLGLAAQAASEQLGVQEWQCHMC